MSAYLNRIATAVPPNDVHSAFVGFAGLLLEGSRTAPVFDRMAKRSQIDHRWSVLIPPAVEAQDGIAAASFYQRGAFPSTAQRMTVYERFAPDLAERAVRGLDLG